MMVMKHCGSLEEDEINSVRYFMVGINPAKVRSVAYAMENTLGSLLSSEAAFKAPENTDEVLGVITCDDEVEVEVEEAIFSL